MAVNKYIIQLIVDTGSGEAKVKGVSKAFEELERSAKKVKPALDSAKKAADGMGGAAGIAGATAAEFGRLVSDLPYGLQAVTNNISQMGSMFALLVSSSGGVFKAFRNLGKVMLGPAGILIAFQAVVAAVEYFSRSSRKAVEVTKEMNAALEAQRKLIQSIALSTTQELEKTAKVLTAYSSEFKDLFENLLKSQGNNKIAIAELIAEYGKLLGIRRQIESKEKAIGALQEGQDKSRAKLLGEINQLRLDEIKALQQLERYSKIEQTSFVDDSDFDSVEEFSDYAIKKILGIKEKIDEPIFGGFFDLKNLEDDVLSEVDALLAPMREARRAALDELVAGGDPIPFYEEELNQLSLFLNNKSKIEELSYEEYKDLKLKEKDLEEFVAESKIRNALAEIDARQGVIDATSSALGSLSSLFAEGTNASKGFALAQIAFDTATGFTQGLSIAQQTAKAAGPGAAFAFPLFYAAQVAAVLAAVGKAKDVLSKSPKVGGSGSVSTPSAPSVVAPAFNIVGAGGQSQLAQAIAGQQQQPIKTYVVAGEVSTAQSLERNRITEASI